MRTNEGTTSQKKKKYLTATVSSTGANYRNRFLTTLDEMFLFVHEINTFYFLSLTKQKSIHAIIINDAEFSTARLYL